MTTTSTLLRRTLVASAAALPALAVPAAAGTSPTAPTTLPPDLIERFVRVRAWYIDYRRREEAHSDEVDRRFYAATGVTKEQYREMNYGHPRRKDHTKICNDTPAFEDGETEGDELGDERWAVAEAIVAHTPQTVTDLAWQLEAFLIADVEILSSPPTDLCDQMLRTLLRHVRALGAIPQPNDPMGALSININVDSDSDDRAQTAWVQS